MTQVLIVDDDPAILEVLRAYLGAAGYTVLDAEDGLSAWPLLTQVDVAVLDWMLPGRSGLDLARAARAAGLTLPILMLTGRGEEADKLHGLDSGMDDYVVKPFSPCEVTARIRVLLRRAGIQNILSAGELLIDVRGREARLSGERLDLTKLEFELLATMAQHAGLAWTRTRLLERIWGLDFPGTERVVDVHMTALRRKLGDTMDTPRFIETVRGVGYRFKEVADE